MIRETMDKVRAAVGESIEVTSRINAYDAIEYPYGWGVARGGGGEPDLAEPIRLLGELAASGLAGVNITIANPYFNPHVNRPADWMIADWPEPPEEPLAGVARLIGIAGDLQQCSGLVRREAGRATAAYAAEQGRLDDMDHGLDLLAPEVAAIEFR